MHDPATRKSRAKPKAKPKAKPEAKPKAKATAKAKVIARRPAAATPGIGEHMYEACWKSGWRVAYEHFRTGTLENEDEWQRLFDTRIEEFVQGMGLQ